MKKKERIKNYLTVPVFNSLYQVVTWINMRRPIIFMLTLTFLSMIKVYGQTENEIFERSKGTWSAPVPKFKTIIDIDYRRDFHSYDATDSSISFIAESSYEVRAVHEGNVIAIFKIDETYAIGIQFGDYFVFYYALEKPFLNRGDRVSKGQTIGKLYKEKDAEDYELLLLVMKHDKLIDASRWFRTLTNEIPDCDSPDLLLVRL